MDERWLWHMTIWSQGPDLKGRHTPAREGPLLRARAEEDTSCHGQSGTHLREVDLDWSEEDLFLSQCSSGSSWPVGTVSGGVFCDSGPGVPVLSGHRLEQ